MFINGVLLSDITNAGTVKYSKDGTDVHKWLFRYVIFYVGMNLIFWDTSKLFLSQPAVAKLCLLCSGGIFPLPPSSFPLPCYQHLYLYFWHVEPPLTISSNFQVIWSCCKISLVFLLDFKSLNDSVLLSIFRLWYIYIMICPFKYFFSNVRGFLMQWNKILFNSEI